MNRVYLDEIAVLAISSSS